MTRAERIAEAVEGMVLQADGFDDAIIGYCGAGVVVYSVDLVIELLMSQGMDDDSAWDFFWVNLCERFEGEKTPVWVFSVPE